MGAIFIYVWLVNFSFETCFHAVSLYGSSVYDLTRHHFYSFTVRLISLEDANLHFTFYANPAVNHLLSPRQRRLLLCRLLRTCGGTRTHDTITALVFKTALSKALYRLSYTGYHQVRDGSLLIKREGHRLAEYSSPHLQQQAL